MMRRGQAALEYLWTYGYAFLAILITLGVLGYFGVFDLGTLRSQECTLPPGAYCQDFVLADDLFGTPGDYELRVDVLNTFGAELNVTAMTATSEVTGYVTCEPTNDSLSFPVNWSEEAFLNLTCPFPSAEFVDGDYLDFTVYLNMSQVGHTYTHTLVGAVATTAQ